MDRGTAGRRTSSDGDSVGSSRAKLTCAATGLKKSLEQDQAETPGSHTGAPTLQPEHGQRGGKLTSSSILFAPYSKLLGLRPPTAALGVWLGNTLQLLEQSSLGKPRNSMA